MLTSKQEVFRHADRLWTPEFECGNVIPGDHYIVMHGGQGWHRIAIHVEHARKLRDWLNKTLPPVETTGSRTNEEAILRGLLAAAYSGSNLYRDDGELQDGAELPIIDYLRDSVLEIERKIQERGRRKLARSQEEPTPTPERKWRGLVAHDPGQCGPCDVELRGIERAQLKAREPLPNDAFRWVCPTCNTVNAIDTRHCDVCTTPRPAQNGNGNQT